MTTPNLLSTPDDHLRDNETAHETCNTPRTLEQDVSTDTVSAEPQWR